MDNVNQPSDLRQLEIDLQRSNRALKTLVQCHEALMRSHSEEQLFDRICRILVDDNQYLLAWIGVAQHDKEKTTGRFV